MYSTDGKSAAKVSAALHRYKSDPIEGRRNADSAETGCEQIEACQGLRTAKVSGVSMKTAGKPTFVTRNMPVMRDKIGRVSVDVPRDTECTDVIVK